MIYVFIRQFFCFQQKDNNKISSNNFLYKDVINIYIMIFELIFLNLIISVFSYSSKPTLIPYKNVFRNLQPGPRNTQTPIPSISSSSSSSSTSSSSASSSSSSCSSSIESYSSSSSASSYIHKYDSSNNCTIGTLCFCPTNTFSFQNYCNSITNTSSTSFTMSPINHPPQPSINPSFISPNQRDIISNQSGLPSVPPNLFNQSNMPDINQSNMPDINQSNMPDINQSNMPDINQSNMPDLNQSNMPDINLSDIPIINQSDIPINQSIINTLNETYNEIECPQQDDLINIPDGCENNPVFYDNFIQGQNQLPQNQTQQIFDNLQNQPPQDINSIIRQAGVLTLNTSKPLEPFQTKTNNFTFYAIQLPPKETNIQIPNFKMVMPQFSIPNTAISVISWNVNPYISNQTINTKIVSISLSNLTGGLISTTLTNPIQLTWSINENVTNYTSLIATCLYWNTSLKNWNNWGCYSVFVNLTTIICNCTHLTDFSARFEAVYTSNINILNNVNLVYSVEGLQKYKNFYIIFGTIGIIGIITFIIGLYLDIKDSKKYYQILIKNDDIKKIKELYTIDICYDTISDELPEIIQDIPKEKTFLSILWNRILFQHSQIGAFMRFDPRLSRVFRFLVIFVSLFNSLFLTALMYGYTYGTSNENFSPMTLTQSFVLSLITVILNVPSLMLLVKLVNLAGLAEFKWRYPILYEELVKRHAFENELFMHTEQELRSENIDYSKFDIKKIESEESKHKINLINNFFEDYFGINSLFSCKKVDKDKIKGSLEKAYYIANKEHENVEMKPYYYIYFPFHTFSGAFVFLISFGWFIWCLNYLLLFSASHSSKVSDDILTSFGFSELQTIFIIQPLFLILLLGISYGINKLKKFIPFLKRKGTLPSMYYFSDPFINPYSTLLSTYFAYHIFINSSSQISYTIGKYQSKIKQLAYANMQIVIDYLEGEDESVSKKNINDKEYRLIQLYNEMNFKPKTTISVTKLFEKRDIKKIQILNYFNKK